MSEKVYIGKVGKSVALKGENRFIADTDFPEQFHKGASFETKKGTLIIESFDQNRSLIKFEGVNTPDDAKKLTNLELYTTLDATKERCDLEEGEYFWFDVIGCEVFDNNKLLGQVESIERINVTDYLLITTDSALRAQKYPKVFMIPFIDKFIEHEDVQNKRIDVEGGLDILEAS